MFLFYQLISFFSFFFFFFLECMRVGSNFQKIEINEHNIFYSAMNFNVYQYWKIFCCLFLKIRLISFFCSIDMNMWFLFFILFSCSITKNNKIQHTLKNNYVSIDYTYYTSLYLKFWKLIIISNELICIITNYYKK